MCQYFDTIGSMIEDKHITRFFSKVDKTKDCWVYTGATWKNTGYGSFSIGKKTYRAHRFSYEIFNGAIKKGLFVLHKCDNPSCVNPNHLFLGSHTDNMKDKSMKNRCNIPTGVNHWHSKFSESDVEEIKRLKELGVPMTKISNIFKVHYNTIRFMFSGRNKFFK